MPPALARAKSATITVRNSDASVPSVCANLLRIVSISHVSYFVIIEPIR